MTDGKKRIQRLVYTADQLMWKYTEDLRYERDLTETVEWLNCRAEKLAGVSI